MNLPLAQKNKSFFSNAILLWIFLFSLYPLCLSAQSDPNFIMDQQGLIINVNNIATHGEISLRDLTANFPYPIMATISVVDNNGVIVTGLADTLRWLKPNDVAENGLPINQIWQPVLEYHEEDRSFPPDPNLYHQLPETQLTEVRWTELVQTSTMLVMDVSSSMREEIDEAKAGACLYVDLMRSVDRGGVVQFSGTVDLFQDMTADATLLKEIINSAILKENTAVYDGILAAIRGIKTELGRRTVIVYTDGGDNSSNSTPEAVIDSAQAYNLPIYSIALGNATEDLVLQQIADSTGGIFFKAATEEEMEEIYRKLSVLMQNYYVMAYASPDPFFNNKWRLVDVKVNLPDREGRGIGRYFVGGPPANMNTDVSAWLASTTDTSIDISGTSMNAVKPGEIYEYTLKAKNLGLRLADTVKVIHFLPDSVEFLNASVTPNFVSDDSLEWIFNDIVPQRELNIAVDVRLRDNIPRTLTDLISEVKVSAVKDTNKVNNFDSDTVKVLFPDLPQNYDLGVTQQVLTDTTIRLGENEVFAIVAGDSYQCLLTITNFGLGTAYDFSLWNVFPDWVTPINLSIPATGGNLDSLFWQFDSLAVGDSIQIAFDLVVADSLPYYPFPLINESELIASNDTTPDNNSTSTTVYAIKKPGPISLPTDLAIALSSVTDTTIYVNQDSVNAVFPGDTFSYLIQVTNLGTNPTDTVQVIQLLPDSVNFISASPQPKFSQKDSLKWEFYNFQPGEKQAISVNVKLADTVPEQLTELISQANLFGANDLTLSNNSALDTVQIISKEPQPQKNYDLSLSQTVITDTTIWLQGDSVKAVLQGDSYRYSLSFTNSGSATAYDITLWDIIPDSVKLSAFNIQPSVQITDSLSWMFDSLTVGNSIQITFDAEVADSLPITPFPLINQSGLIAQNDTLVENNFSVTTVYGIQKQEAEKPGAADVALSLVSLTDTSIVEDQKRYNAVKPGEKFQYLISVKNNGPNSADSLKLFHQLPDSVQFLDATVPAQILDRTSLFWEFDNIKAGAELKIAVSVQLSADAPKELTELISSAFLTATNDSTENNNFAADTVKVLFHELPISLNYNLAVSQEVSYDTTITVGGETVRAVWRGNNYNYFLKVQNFGPVTARDFRLWDALPDSISISNISLAPVIQNPDSLFWQLDSLARGDSIIIALAVSVAEALPYTPFPLFNRTGLIAEHDTSIVDNISSSQIYAIERSGGPRPFQSDIAVTQAVVTDSFAVVRNDTSRFAKIGEIYSYTITITNVSSVAAQDVKVINILPDSVTISDYQPLPEFITEDSLVWSLGALLPQTKIDLHFNAIVASQMPIGKNFLINEVKVTASNEDPTRLSNNHSTSTVINLVKPPGDWQPYIEALPQIVKAGNPISVRVKVTAPIESWELWIYLANGQIDSSYGNSFIASNSLAPDVWKTIDPAYSETRLYTEAKKEELIFELRAWDVLGELKTAKATVTVESDDDLVIDKDVFIPDRDNELPIRFKLSSDRQVRLEIFDITGTKITNVADGQFQAGWNTYAWNGLTDNGQKIGSGFYILTIRSGEYQAWKKLMIVR